MKLLFRKHSTENTLAICNNILFEMGFEIGVNQSKNLKATAFSDHSDAAMLFDLIVKEVPGGSEVQVLSGMLSTATGSIQRDTFLETMFYSKIQSDVQAELIDVPVNNYFTVC